jgi:hypothetical protein
MIVVSIDIGYHNLGMVNSIVDDKTYEIKILDVFKIDITKIIHKKIKRYDCKLYHTSELSDYFSHFVQEFGDILDQADKILIERQPPGGLTNVEALFVYTYRDKIELISPNSMHKHFQINFLEYEKRKEKTIEFSESFLENFKEYQELSRKHDIADAVCMIIFKFAKHKEKYRLSKVDRSVSFENFLFVKQ